jgi:tRNA modification GTPase
MTEDGDSIDRGLVLFFSAPGSYTGEDVVELHAHGGTALLSLLLARCLALGARVANPGEFTQRAFLNGKLDLVQAESVADLIEAATATAVRAAARNLEGVLSTEVERLAQGLKELRALVEAAIDFPDEEGVDLVPEELLGERLSLLQGALDKLRRQAAQGHLLREGLHVVLVGAPNVGKSSLLNRFAGRDVAIVASVPGTTRDALKEALEVRGVPLHLVDTAGLRAAQDEVEALGIERTRRAIGHADLALLVIAPPEAQDALPGLLAELPGQMPHIVVCNKVDLDGSVAGPRAGRAGPEFGVSARTGAGIEALSEHMLELVGWQAGTGEVVLARTRHLDALARVATHLIAGGAEIARRELFAEELRLAQQALGEICGATLPEDLLGEIFGRFCIGK